MTASTLARVQPAWPLPLLLAVQVALFRTFADYLAAGPAWVTLLPLPIAALMAFLAARNCRRLLAIPEHAASGALLASLVVALLAVLALVAGRAVEEGAHWPDLAAGAAAGFLGLLAARECRRLLRSGRH